MDLNGFKIFVEVVHQGSFSGAAQELQIPVSTVSRKVTELEAAIEQRLIERSTRKLRLTESGELLLPHAEKCVQEMEAGVSYLQEKQQQLKGRLRIAVPPNFEPSWVLLEAFQKKHPDVQLQMLSISRPADPIADSVDVVVQFGASTNQSLIGLNLAKNKRRLVATKEFVEQHGKPTSPADLVNFPILAWSAPATTVEWQLGEERVELSPYLLCTEFSLIKIAALSGKGVAQLPPYYCIPELEKGTFVELLEDYPPPATIIQLLYPSRKQLSPVTRALIDFCRAYIAKEEQMLRWEAI